MIFQYIEEHSQQAAITLSALTFLFGLLIGNWQAIGRDRRKEFNAVSDRIRSVLIKQRGNCSPFSPTPDNFDIEVISDYLWPRSRSRFRKAFFLYQQSRHSALQQDNLGGAFYRDTTEIDESIEKILRHLKRR